MPWRMKMNDDINSSEMIIVYCPHRRHSSMRWQSCNDLSCDT